MGEDEKKQAQQAQAQAQAQEEQQEGTGGSPKKKQQQKKKAEGLRAGGEEAGVGSEKKKSGSAPIEGRPGESGYVRWEHEAGSTAYRPGA